MKTSMRSCWRVSTYLLVLSLAGLSKGYLKELKNFHAEAWNELRRERIADLPLEEAVESLHQVRSERARDTESVTAP